MTAVTTLPTFRGPAVDRRRPLVLVEGVPAPDLGVVSLAADGPLDERQAELTGIGDAEALADRSVTVLETLPLTGDPPRPWVLVAGRVERETSSAGPRGPAQRRVVRDAWSERLDQAPASVWWADAGRRFAAASGVAEVGLDANRSADRHTIAGRQVHVLQRAGLAWTVEQVLDVLGALHGLTLNVAMLSTAIREAPLEVAIDLAGPLRKALASLCERHGLFVQRTLLLSNSRAVDRVTMRCVEHGRRIAVGGVVRRRQDAAAPVAEHWILRGAPLEVEATLVLVPGWEASLAGGDPSLYSPASNPTFSRYADVYRRWVLGEDGSTADGPTCDLAALLGLDVWRPQRMPLLPCLVSGAGGARVRPIVEMSLDGGATWTAWPGEHSVLGDRAGVTLDDPTLPTDYLAAAIAGDARIRVTATLRSPVATERSRWRGNPFAPAWQRRLFDAADRFVFRRVDASSIHRASLDPSALAAIERDDGRAMEAWLTAQLRRAEAGAFPTGRATLQLAGALPGVAVGDRLSLADGVGHVRASRSDFASRTTDLTLDVTPRSPGACDASGTD